MHGEPYSFPPDLPTDVPTAARCYDYMVSGKDNFAVDRAAVLELNQRFPESLDGARANRLFLYRVVRFLTREAGIRQFLDLGSGLPAQDNVHQVAQRFAPEARVIYVDNDPIVLAHGRAVLADEHTTILTADLTDPESVLEAPEAQRLLDFTQPLAILMVGVPHSIPDDDAVHSTIRTLMAHAPSGSYLALSQVIAVNSTIAAESSATVHTLGIPWRTRTAPEVDAFVSGLHPVTPGLVDVNDWRPDPEQPSLGEVDAPLRPFLGAATDNKRVSEYGGVLRKP